MDLQVRLEGVNELAATLSSLPSEAKARMRRVLSEVQLEILRGIVIKLGGSVLQRRTGTLSRSFRAYPIEETTTEMSARVASTNVVYGPPQERGAKISPSSARFLTIPLDAMTTGRGVARGSARDVISDPEAFGFGGTFFRKGLLLGVKKLGGKWGRTNVFALFLLKSGVTIPPHYFVRDTVVELEATFRSKVLGAARG